MHRNRKFSETSDFYVCARCVSVARLQPLAFRCGFPPLPIQSAHPLLWKCLSVSINNTDCLTKNSPISVHFLQRKFDTFFRVIPPDGGIAAQGKSSPNPNLITLSFRASPEQEDRAQKGDKEDDMQISEPRRTSHFRNLPSKREAIPSFGNTDADKHS